MAGNSQQNPDYFNYQKVVYWIILGSFIIRAFLAYSFQLGNDEVYYWVLAANPALNYFDHPPMFAYFINLFSLGLKFDSELFIRFSSIVVFSINTWTIFSIGKTLQNARTGFLAVLLYQSSIYSFIITGVMIMPDTPLSLFLLLAMRSFLIALPSDHISYREKHHMILAGFFIGLAIISKYQSIIFWVGAAVFIVLHKREWFKKPQLYLAVLLSLAVVSPILWTNLSGVNSNISFQTNRIELFSELKPQYFFREFLGQFLYNNPINVLLAIVAIASYRKKKFMKKSNFEVLIWFGIPGIAAFLFFSIFSPTLPHWSAPAYYALIFISAAYLDQVSIRKFPLVTQFALGFLLIIIVLAWGQVNHGLLYYKPATLSQNQGENDLTLDLYGWNQVNEKVQTTSFPIYPETKTLVARKWYNAAHFDYYVARKNSMKLIALGSIMDIHEYRRINILRGELKKGEHAWFIAVSRDFQDPYIHFSSSFEKIEHINTIPIHRNNQIVEYAFVYHLENYCKE